ncbi:hypothetical protein BFW01_g8316 [Lasiodiplodia theobromae]|uniref:DUF7598 domain-containing protein n=2 Tax=Lasiodiplodia TaxID=66739 RepID=A0A5N5DBG1_9PEZI|nr:uncharacterized protein LTHEOB_1245 [Lasiodiplodia theobromae]KAB2575128.1 hypothetical protein DBV05_g6218 [Lasiodiplodia theobromae]KAF4538891.1 hypothetical protein LTHEOB_1245 [Lasiodiplodia theobromae]KAF9637420.1 hypothetical protein BFW01_g8316 [Lasiodiplodia theobromae]KAK0647589.1 hypothetical protein DIS24_g7628 [Lasiodiplodia hormozganensis]
MSVLISKNLAGPAYIILNVVRALNIIGLLLVATASFLMLVKTIVVSRFFFFDGCSHVITACISCFLIASEACLFRSYFRKNWPLFSPEHGFVALGLAMILLGVNTLGNLNKDATSAENLGMPFWSVVISSGIIILVLGFVNIFVSYIFRDTKLRITARNVRASGAVAIQDAEAQLEAEKTLSIKSSMQSMTLNQSPWATPRKSPAPSNSPRPTYSPTRTIFQQARASLLPSHFRTSRYSASNYSRSFFGGRPDNDEEKPPVPPVPPYPASEAGSGTTAAPSFREKAGRSHHQHKKSSSKDSTRSKRESKRSSLGRFPINISSPLNTNPRFASLVNGIKKPDLAHHPSQRQRRVENGQDDNPYELPPDF